MSAPPCGQSAAPRRYIYRTVTNLADDVEERSSAKFLPAEYTRCSGRMLLAPYLERDRVAFARSQFVVAFKGHCILSTIYSGKSGETS